MKRFRFPLRPVTVLRAHYELRAREAFAAAVHVYVQAEAELAAVRTRVAHCEAELCASRRERFDAAAAANAFAAYRRECAAEGAAERAVFASRAEMNQRRADYLEAHRKLEVVNRLEVKARAAHRLETLREEQIELDDFAGRRTGAPQFSQP
jgi:flagellar FliJ protein